MWDEHKYAFIFLESAEQMGQKRGKASILMSFLSASECVKASFFEETKLQLLLVSTFRNYNLFISEAAPLWTERGGIEVSSLPPGGWLQWWTKLLLLPLFVLMDTEGSKIFSFIFAAFYLTEAFQAKHWTSSVYGINCLKHIPRNAQLHLNWPFRLLTCSLLTFI